MPVPRHSLAYPRHVMRGRRRQWQRRSIDGAWRGTSQANELARQINAGAFDAHKWATSQWDPSTAKLLKQHSGPGSIALFGRCPRYFRFTPESSGLLCPDERTSSARPVNSESANGRLTHRGRAMSSLDHLVGASDHCGWHFKVQHLRGDQVDDQIKFRWLFARSPGFSPPRILATYVAVARYCS